MSGKTARQERESARERVLAEAARRRDAQSRQRKIIAVVAALVVIAAAVLIGVLVQNHRAAQTAAKVVTTPRGVSADGLTIPVGQPSAKATMVLYEDFRCPVCGSFEKQFGSTVSSLVADGTLKIQYHIASFIDDNATPPGKGSKRAANAAGCAQDAGKFDAYHNVLYANQPAETSDSFTNARLIQLAKQVPGLDSSTFESCVNSGTHAGWVTKVQKAFDTAFNGAVATPTIILNGKELTGAGMTTQDPALTSPATLKAAILAAAGK